MLRADVAGARVAVAPAVARLVVGDGREVGDHALDAVAARGLALVVALERVGELAVTEVEVLGSTPWCTSGATASSCRRGPGCGISLKPRALVGDRTGDGGVGVLVGVVGVRAGCRSRRGTRRPCRCARCSSSTYWSCVVAVVAAGACAAPRAAAGSLPTLRTVLPLMVSGVASPLSTSAHACWRSAACFSASGLGSTWSELADCASPLLRLVAAGAAAVDGARVSAPAPVMRARESPRVVDLTRFFLSERQEGGRDQPDNSLPCGP